MDYAKEGRYLLNCFSIDQYGYQDTPEGRVHYTGRKPTDGWNVLNEFHPSAPIDAEWVYSYENQRWETVEVLVTNTPEVEEDTPVIVDTPEATAKESSKSASDFDCHIPENPDQLKAALNELNRPKHRGVRQKKRKRIGGKRARSSGPHHTPPDQCKTPPPPRPTVRPTLVSVTIGYGGTTQTF